MMYCLVLILVCALVACAGKSKRTALPVLTLLFTASAVSADTTFTAAWDALPNDSTDYDYVLYVDGTTPPGRELWRGRVAVTAGRMSKTFLFSETGLPILVTSVCAAVRAEHRVTQKTKALSNIVCLPADFTTPGVVTNFSLTAQ